MSEIDQVSQTLGRLEAQNTIIVDNIKDINKHLRDLNGKTAKAHERLDNTVSKKDAVKAIIGFGALGGFGSTGILKAIAVFMGVN